MSRLVVALLFASLAITSPAYAIPRTGQRIPTVSVDDLDGVRHTERDMASRWTVAIAMTDKDAGDGVAAWWRALDHRVQARPSAQLLTFVAVDLFPLLLTSTVVGRARSATPRHRWSLVWFSRDGSFAQQLGLPSSETPWVLIFDPSGRVADVIHSEMTPEGVDRVLSAIGAQN